MLTWTTPYPVSTPWPVSTRGVTATGLAEGTTDGAGVAHGAADAPAIGDAAGDAPGTADAVGGVTAQVPDDGTTLASGTGDALAKAVDTSVPPEPEPEMPMPDVEAMVGVRKPIRSAAAPVVRTTRPTPRRRRECRCAEFRAAGGAVRSGCSAGNGSVI